MERCEIDRRGSQVDPGEADEASLEAPVPRDLNPGLGSCISIIVQRGARARNGFDIAIDMSGVGIGHDVTNSIITVNMERRQCLLTMAIEPFSFSDAR